VTLRQEPTWAPVSSLVPYETGQPSSETGSEGRAGEHLGVLTLIIPLLLPNHPDHRILATIPLRPDTTRGHEGELPSAQLHWTDGPLLGAT